MPRLSGLPWTFYRSVMKTQAGLGMRERTTITSTPFKSIRGVEESLKGWEDKSVAK